MRTNHLATIMQDCWIRNTVGVQGVFEESVWFFSQRWQTSAQACICS